MTIARRHHYVPQGYLAAFTNNGTKDGQFNVMDVDSGDTFRTSPKNVALARDFNRVDIDGQAIDALESSLSSFETLAVGAIRKVLSSRTFPDSTGRNVILNLLGLIAVRNPRRRQSFNQAREHTLNMIGDLLVSDRGVFEHHIRRAAEAGDISDTNVSFERLKKFVEERQYTIEFLPQENSRIEFAAFDELLPLLGQRTWSLFIAPSGGPEFICSDHPVALTWKAGNRGPLGFALRRTEVFFPLGRHVGIYGTFEDPKLPEVNLKPIGVAAMNTRVAMHSERYVFSAQECFVVLHEGHAREVVCSYDKR